MSKPIFTAKSRQEEFIFAKNVNAELDRMTMSWTNELREWYPIAIRALEFASANDLQVPQHKVVELFKEDTHGINMNVIMALCNNIELRKPVEMGVSARKWSEILLMNHAVANRWQELALPAQEKVAKEIELMRGIPDKKIVSM